MKKTMDLLSDRRYKRVMGIDPSTKTISMAMVVNGTPQALISLELKHGDIYTRLKSLRSRFGAIMDAYSPELVIIESPIMVQNPLSTKHMAYAVGIIFGECLARGVRVEDIPPMTWKSFFGYSSITKQQKDEIMDIYGATEGRKVLKKMRKGKIQDTLKKRYPHLSKQLDDDNLADALAIALYTWSVYGQRD